MKKTIIKWSIIIAAVIILVCCLKFFSGRWVLPSQVKGVQLRGYYSCDAPNTHNVALSEDEVRKLLYHYNFASYAGSVTADSCISEFGFTIYMEDGSYIHVKDAHTRSPLIEVSPLHGERYWVKSEALADYALELVEKYGLPVS